MTWTEILMRHSPPGQWCSECEDVHCVHPTGHEWYEDVEENVRCVYCDVYKDYLCSCYIYKRSAR